MAGTTVETVTVIRPVKVSIGIFNCQTALNLYSVQLSFNRKNRIRVLDGHYL